MSFTTEVLLAAAGTYLLRVSVIAFAAGREIPESTRRILALVPVAVLPAIIADALVFDGAQVRDFGPWYPAFAIAVVVAATTRSVGWTLASGMGAVWILTAVWP
ncbi:MAG: AzlD domain-containing protein [Microthrixaceae bacterium]|nr:AzlD domain-containing protein [Microthrixaceae bacterium]MCO5317494.1 AzlD domain-containing protein [Microthrixaceae bacterium]